MYCSRQMIGLRSSQTLHTVMLLALLRTGQAVNGLTSLIQSSFRVSALRKSPAADKDYLIRKVFLGTLVWCP